jgi:hypothetical protein
MFQMEGEIFCANQRLHSLLQEMFWQNHRNGRLCVQGVIFKICFCSTETEIFHLVQPIPILQYKLQIDIYYTFLSTLHITLGMNFKLTL